MDAPAIKGISGHVIGSGQTFTIRDDYDFSKPTIKGYHVNAQLGKTTVAFTSGQNYPQAYYDQVSLRRPVSHLERTHPVTEYALWRDSSWGIEETIGGIRNTEAQFPIYVSG